MKDTDIRILGRKGNIEVSCMRVGYDSA